MEELDWGFADGGKYTKAVPGLVRIPSIPIRVAIVVYLLICRYNSMFEYRKTFRACVAILSYGVEASLIINSEYEGGEDVSPCGLLRGAFDFAKY